MNAQRPFPACWFSSSSPLLHAHVRLMLVHSQEQNRSHRPGSEGCGNGQCCRADVCVCVSPPLPSSVYTLRPNEPPLPPPWRFSCLCACRLRLMCRMPRSASMKSLLASSRSTSAATSSAYVPFSRNAVMALCVCVCMCLCVCDCVCVCVRARACVSSSLYLSLSLSISLHLSQSLSPGTNTPLSVPLLFAQARDIKSCVIKYATNMAQLEEKIEKAWTDFLPKAKGIGQEA